MALNHLLRGLLLPCLLVAIGRAAARETVSLDGTWNFATDPGDRGETQQWYRPGVKLPAMPLPGYAPAANGAIRVPGIWDNQGYGTETENARHNFVGKGWYKRQVAILRAWAGRRVFLVITGVSRYAKAWINERFLGEHVGYLSAWECDVTPYAEPGATATITVQVDSKQRWEVDTMRGCSSLDAINVPWGGIWGHVFLEARSEVWLSDLYVRPDVPNAACSVTAMLNGNAGLADGARLEVFDSRRRRVAERATPLDSRVAARQPVSAKVPLPVAALWTPENPTLYTARLSLMRGGEVLDAIESRFGMRQFAIDGFRLLLNGKRLMLRGYGDDHVYPEQMAMPSDKELHVRRLQVIKSYGFNYVRHHSTMMPPEYYDACDEAGMITTAEFPVEWDGLIPGLLSGPSAQFDQWTLHVKPGTDPKPAVDTFQREWAGAIVRHRNHPCILGWVMGNEIGWDNPHASRWLLNRFRDIAKELDPLRLFLDTDGNLRPDLPASPQRDRPTLAFYTIQFADEHGPPLSSGKFDIAEPIKPVLSHEAGNYVTFSRPDLPDQFRHNLKPSWLTGGKRALEELGLLQEAGDWAEKSERLYALLHKYNLESLRKNPYVSGYNWWLFQDFWGSSDGIVDHYFRPKSITKEEVLKFNGAVVLLQDGLGRTYRGNERLGAKLLVSNFSAEPLQGELAWEVKAADESLAGGRAAGGRIPQGRLVEAARIDLPLPDSSSPRKLSLAVKLTAGGKCFANDWRFWLYPAASRLAAPPVPVFVEEGQIQARGNPGATPIPATGDLESRAVYVVSWPSDPRVLDAMKRGASVVALDGVDVLAPCSVSFATTWWCAGGNPQTNYTGTFVYDHPSTRAMAPDGWCDEGWLDLLEGASKCALEAMPARPKIIIRALPSLALVKDDALLFEVGVEKGSLIVSGLNHRRAQGRPENEWLVARLADYAATFPKPAARWPASFFPLAGFRRLLVNPGEDGYYPSYREEHARLFVCRQTKRGNLIAWETSPMPKDFSGDRVTFVFSGGLGFSSQPKTEGFVLEIDGRDAVRFDMPATGKWESTDKRVELRLDVRRRNSLDEFGLYFLKLPRDMLKAGQPCRLGVRSLGTGSQRSFFLNPYLGGRACAPPPDRQ
jgi:hypothetical protein